MCKVFPNQDHLRPLYKHNTLPLLITDEFDFYRCIGFNDNFYGKTVSELHAGNLRLIDKSNRYSTIFSGQKVSYWADSIKTARAEYKYHNKNKSYISFWSYDDASSSFPTFSNKQALVIVDGSSLGFHNILEKYEQGEPLTNEEVQLIKDIERFQPDCLAYNSLRNTGGMNCMFFEKGFNKLSLREVTLRISRGSKYNKNTIVCAFGSDYTPYPYRYGMCFFPITRIHTNDNYLNSDEYKNRNRVYLEHKKSFIEPFLDLLKKSGFYDKLEHNNDKTGTVN